LPAEPLGRTLEALERLAEAAGDDGGEELLLRAEQAEDVRLRDAGPAGDLVGRGAAEACLRKHRRCGVEDLLAPHRLRLPLGARRCHAPKIVVTYYCVKSVSVSATRSRSLSERLVWNGSARAR